MAKNVVGVGEQDALGGRNVVGLVKIGAPGEKYVVGLGKNYFRMAEKIK